ncbi:hypothetical protein JHK85_054955 [Glycine max]|nr:hypothetical protein JHK85_054955 [Glycine max]
MESVLTASGLSSFCCASPPCPSIYLNSITYHLRPLTLGTKSVCEGEYRSRCSTKIVDAGVTYFVHHVWIIGNSLVSCTAGKYALRFLSFGLVVEEFKVTLKLVGEIGDNCLRLFWTTYGEIETKECSRSLVHDIKEFGQNKGVYTWSQTLREGNQPADLVATYGLQLQEQLRVFEFFKIARPTWWFSKALAAVPGVFVEARRS